MFPFQDRNLEKEEDCRGLCYTLLQTPEEKKDFLTKIRKEIQERGEETPNPQCEFTTMRKGFRVTVSLNLFNSAQTSEKDLIPDITISNLTNYEPNPLPESAYYTGHDETLRFRLYASDLLKNTFSPELLRCLERRRLVVRLLLNAAGNITQLIYLGMPENFDFWKNVPDDQFLDFLIQLKTQEAKIIRLRDSTQMAAYQNRTAYAVIPIEANP